MLALVTWRLALYNACASYTRHNYAIYDWSDPFFFLQNFKTLETTSFPATILWPFGWDRRPSPHYGSPRVSIYTWVMLWFWPPLLPRWAFYCATFIIMINFSTNIISGDIFPNISCCLDYSSATCFTVHMPIFDDHFFCTLEGMFSSWRWQTLNLAYASQFQSLHTNIFRFYRYLLLTFPIALSFSPWAD